MNIGYILSEPVNPNGTSGASVHVSKIIEGLRNKGHKVNLFSHNYNFDGVSNSNSGVNGFSFKNLFKNSVKKIVPRGIVRPFKNYLKYRRNMRMLNGWENGLKSCDLIYERDGVYCFKSQKLAEKYDLPYIIECNGFFWEEQMFDGLAFKKLYKRRHVQKWKSADHLIAVSGEFKKKMVGLGIDEGKVSVLHNGVEMDVYEVPSKKITDLRNSFGFSENNVVIGFIGHILPWHRLDILVEGIAQLNKGGYPVKGLIVGGGKLDKVFNEVDRLGLKENIVFTGAVPQNQVPVHIKAMDICTIPGSSSYNSPVKLFNYGAAGRPVLATNRSSITEIIDDGRNGLLFYKESQSSFNEQLEELLKDQVLRKELGKNIRSDIEKHHTWNDVVDRTEKILESSVKHK
ncbi:glycosyltransferase family 4 protein [Fodinibius sp. AD559]|uniref:glycosyltransferase family 4 protein n=1 Tax=Fodinibius sp. AD559 TaxID=3424179 RepID=UPI0040469791